MQHNYSQEENKHAKTKKQVQSTDATIFFTQKWKTTHTQKAAALLAQMQHNYSQENTEENIIAKTTNKQKRKKITRILTQNACTDATQLFTGKHRKKHCKKQTKN